MNIIKITKADLDTKNKYKLPEIGKWDEYEDVSVEIDENLGYVVFEKGVYVRGSIVCKAGSGIKAGWGIKAGEGINCKLALNVAYRIFAGTATFRNTDNEEKEITCGKLEKGTVCYGTLKETGMPDAKTPMPNLTGKEVEVKIDGTTYKAIIK